MNFSKITSAFFLLALLAGLLFHSRGTAEETVEEPAKRITKFKADYLIYGTEKSFTNFMRINTHTTYKTLINEVNIFYDYGLSKGSKQKWEPSRNLLKTEIKTSYNRDPYDYSFIFEDNQDKISIFSRFYTAAVGGFRGNTRGDIGYGFGQIGHDNLDIITVYARHEMLFLSNKDGDSRWKKSEGIIRTLDMNKITYPAILVQGNFSYKIPRQLSSQRSIILTELSLHYMFTRRVRSIASLKWFYDGNAPPRKQHRYDIRAGMGLTYEF